MATLTVTWALKQKMTLNASYIIQNAYRPTHVDLYVVLPCDCMLHNIYMYYAKNDI